MDLKICINHEETEVNNYLERLYENHTNYHEGDSGLDLFCPEEITVLPGETKKINLGISCSAEKDFIEFNDNTIKCKKVPTSYYMYPRSSIVKTPLRLANSVGIIDAGYRGNLMAFVDNIKTDPYTIEKGTRLFQICSPDLSPIKFKLVNILDETSRGNGGFGSTNN
jgi:dUTP pyrophosphatase